MTARLGPSASLGPVRVGADGQVRRIQMTERYLAAFVAVAVVAVVLLVPLPAGGPGQHPVG